ncbi:CPBP family intramembrane glutamic endopeptidase [Oceanobacillus halotolerans]|uniref:CPBP family intramembrane glutamic endopeptidase n=1 Tax=Oceanobacillus halotolerans TaxID=2663380 RepID=UPI0013DB25E5|nr:type II CAAX endopeptidase family protein [Oceanobacillus halotolerans]
MTRRYWYVILTYIIMQFSGILFAPILYFIFPLSEMEAIIYWSIISFVLGLIIILVLLRQDMKQGSARDAAPARSIILWAIGGLFMAYFANGIASTIEMELLGIQPESENTQMIMDISRMSPIFMIIPAIIAPILEEIVFRKVIFSTLYKRMNFFFAALISSGVFGIIHGEPEHLLVYSSMGFVFAFLYVKTKRIIVPIMVHAAINTISVMIQYFFNPEELEQILNELETAVIFIGG